MTSPTLRAQNISVSYGRGAARVDALRNTSMQVCAGELVMVTGPSGSGKTTLLQVIGGLISPDLGVVAINGEQATTIPEEARSRLRRHYVGFVFQHYRLFPTLRAWENVAISLELNGVRGAAAEHRGRALLEQVGLSRQADAFPSQLSGGQKQRVAIARALAGEPAAILADEPTGALDSSSGLRIAELLRDLAHREGRAVLMVTHDIRLVPLADRTVTLEDGRITTPAEDMSL